MLKPSSRLQSHLNDFLGTFRLGVDFGEAAGGIALVHHNEILHAETFIDFHETTLQQRRTLRRGRRSRHAKKMRLARLRSWILRQSINGERLPDPYEIMRRHRFQTKPEIYKQK